MKNCTAKAYNHWGGLAAAPGICWIACQDTVKVVKTGAAEESEETFFCHHRFLK